MNIDLLKKAYDVIEAIPDNVIDLGLIRQRCRGGTVCCAAGWLAHDSEFQAEGLSMPAPDQAGRVCAHLLFGGKVVGWDRAMSLLFDMPIHQAVDLFCPRTLDERLGFLNLTDKQLWLHRVREYLSESKREADDLACELRDPG